MKVVVYLTHPLGEKLLGDISARGRNISNACEWYYWLIRSTNWAVNASWLVDIMANDEELTRPRALIDQLAQIMRCDALLLGGGMISPHMKLKRDFAQKHSKPIIDTTGHLGRIAPEYGSRPPGKFKTWESWLESIATAPIVQMVK